MVISKKKPSNALGYLTCPNVQSCTMASRNQSWIWDYGVGTKSDSCMCKECHYLFARGRISTHGAYHGPRPKSHADGRRKSPGPPKSPKTPKGNGKGADKDKEPVTHGANTSAIDMEALMAQLQQLCACQEQGLELDLGPIRSMVVPVPEEPSLTVADKIHRQIKHLESQKSAKQTKVTSLQRQLAALGKDLTMIDAELAEQQLKYNQTLSSLQTSQEEEISIENYQHVGDDVHISLESLSMWDADKLMQYQAKLEASNLAVQLALDAQAGKATMPTVKEEDVPMTTDASSIVNAGDDAEEQFGPAALASARSGPYTPGTRTFPSAGSLSDQAAFTLENYGAGTAGELESCG